MSQPESGPPHWYPAYFEDPTPTPPMGLPPLPPKPRRTGWAVLAAVVWFGFCITLVTIQVMHAHHASTTPDGPPPTKRPPATCDYDYDHVYHGPETKKQYCAEWNRNADDLMEQELHRN